jgi:hypothetical protein
MGFCCGRCRRERTSQRGARSRPRQRRQRPNGRSWWNPERADFDVETAENIDREPTWPKESFEQLLKLGYADHIVDNEDHYYVRRLRGVID